MQPSVCTAYIIARQAVIRKASARNFTEKSRFAPHGKPKRKTHTEKPSGTLPLAENAADGLWPMQPHQPLNALLILSMKLFLDSYSRPVEALSNWRRSSFCRSFRRRGVSTRTRKTRSPFCLD